jgi:hypothetical protein
MVEKIKQGKGEQKITSVGKNVEKLEPCGNAKWYSCCGEQ